MLLSDEHHNISLSGEREVSVVNTTMSTMNDVHQFRVRTPSFLISADNLPVQVRRMLMMFLRVLRQFLDECSPTSPDLCWPAQTWGGEDKDQCFRLDTWDEGWSLNTHYHIMTICLWSDYLGQFFLNQRENTEAFILVRPCHLTIQTLSHLGICDSDPRRGLSRNWLQLPPT